MSELRIGDKLKDNDPRMGNRVLTVIDFTVDGQRVMLRDSMGTVYRHKMSRVYTDGKPRKSGLSLVAAIGAAQQEPTKGDQP